MKTVALADHQAITEQDMLNIAPANQTVMMTEKDAVKCRAFAEGHANWWYLPVDAQLDSPLAETLLKELLGLVR
ncbi:Tetraacyldisaccharide 4'-kinase [Cedecea neteri]|uniref:Tetraacyldisaccharide 4'-kinase n=1 Tax=Cedecea neteri TaxID=158822 RepID=A0A2X2V3A5_9ENTR|nr:Tetraacyldisaccharide 4'-kinase [Cedecea neteri]